MSVPSCLIMYVCALLLNNVSLFQHLQKHAGAMEPTRVHAWLASFNFIQLSFCSICTSSASLLVEWRMKNSREKKTPVTKCYLKAFSCSCEQTATRRPLHIQKKDGQIAQYDCVDPDYDHSAHRVFLNSWTTHDRLIVSNSFWFFFFHLCHFCSVWFK